MTGLWRASAVLFTLLSATAVRAQAPGVADDPNAPPAAAPGGDPAPEAPREPPPAPPESPPPTPGPAAPPSLTPPVEATRNDDAELRALREEVETLKALSLSAQAPTEDASAYEERLRLYGYMDMGFQKLWLGRDNAALATGTTRAGTFVLGNVNLYVDATPVRSFRALTEVRLTNYPDGAVSGDNGSTRTPAETSIHDVNAPDPGWAEVNWGSIVLEQAWVQGTATDWFSVRLGSWLTPFGIWNIDHGSPTVIGLNRPQFTRGRFYPDRQLGLQLLGHVTSEAWTFGYAAYVSNGKTQGGLDTTDDKAFGGRLSAETTRPFPLKVGVAGYTGRFSRRSLEPSATVLLGTVENEVAAYRQWDLGVDLSIDVDDFRFRTEAALERIEYDEDKRESIWGVPGTQWPDRTIWGFYTLAAQRLPWLGLEPYVSMELFRYPSPLSEAIATPGAGLNVHFTTEALLKTQFTRAYFFDFDGDHDHGAQNASMFATRFVLAY